MPDSVNIGVHTETRTLGGFFGASFRGCGYTAAGFLAIGGTAALVSAGTLALPSGLAVGLACANGGAGAGTYYLLTGEEDVAGSLLDAGHSTYELYY